MLILSILSQIPNLVVSVENAFGAGAGDNKLSAIVSSASQIAVAAGANPSEVKTVSDIATTAANATVSILNSVGVFQKQAPVPTSKS